MTFTMSATMAGPHDFRITVKTNDPVEPNRVFRLLSNWIPPAGTAAEE